MEAEKEYSPQEKIIITMTREQWDTVLQWLEYGADYHHAKMTECLYVCADKRMAREIAGNHQRSMERAESLCKIVEAVLYPQPATETE